ncbi:DNA-directed RNA polymerase subunit H [Candidatus Woesearchaeota archaeon]|nr:DNA-directed RNA polymerase subunit H [Candidatus Woesearchaeota archaeon]
MEMEIDVSNHGLVPKHTKLSDAEKEKLLSSHSLSVRDLPKILITDPAVLTLNLKAGDVVKIERSSMTAGTSIYYRVVVNG